MIRPLVIYHSNCADGFGAAFAAWTALGDSAEYYPMQYMKKADGAATFLKQMVDDLEHCSVVGREIYILDFSLPLDAMNFLFSSASRVVWLDHHKTAFEMAGVQPGITFVESHSWPLGADDLNKHHIELNNDKSGALLAWEFFHPDFGLPSPLLFRYIDDYDRWQFKIDGTKALNKAIWSRTPWSFQQWHDWLYLLDHNLDGPYVTDSLLKALIDEGEALLRAHDANVRAVVKGSTRKVTIDRRLCAGDSEIYTGLAANCPPFLTSDVGHELATQSGTFGLCWTMNQEHMVANCSLRSNGDYDVSAIAKAFGGGGHKNAAGFEVPIDLLLEWLK